MSDNFFKKSQVLIIGDVMIDRYVSGSVSRISPEAPVPVLDWQKTENRLGGAANVALNIKALDAEPILVGMIGNDEDGELFQQLLNDEYIDNQYIIKINQRTTTIKTRFLAGRQQLLRLDKEVSNDLSNTESTFFIEKIKKIIDNQLIDVIIFQDYNKGLLTDFSIKRLMALASKKNIPTCIDPKKKNFAAYQNATLFKPNLKEMSVFLNRKIESNFEDLERAAIDFLQHSYCQNLMITLSEKGIFIHNNEKNAILPTTPRHIADVCGAGDTVIAVAALGIANGFSSEKIATMCNIAGGQVCEEVGVVPIRKDKFWKEIYG